MNKYLKLFTPVIFLISLVIINNVKTVKSGKLWNNYSVLYVPVETEDYKVVETLRNNNINDYIALSEQYLPLNFSENSIEVSMFRLSANNDEYNYIKKRNAFFFDKSNKYRLYYIPVENQADLINSVNILNKQNIQCGVDSSTSYPWLLILILFIFILMICLFSKNKLLFLISCITPFNFLFSNPFYPVAISMAFLILCILFVTNIWNRNGFFNSLFKNYITIVLFAGSILCVISCGIITTLLYFLVILSVISIIICYSSIENYIRNKKSFIPVLIKPAKLISLFAKKTKPVMLISTGAVFVIISLFFLSFSDTVNTHLSKLLLPSANGIQSDDLPQLDDYYEWNWNIQTYPYKSLNFEYDDNHIEYPTYNVNENGLLEEKINELEYNQQYKENVFNNIDNLPFKSIEKVMKSEGDNFKSGYSSTSSYQTSFFGIIMMFICLFMLLFIYISIIIGKGSKK